MPVYLLVDNGSKKPEATLQLRQLAASLGQHTGKLIHAVSLQHANDIDPAQLDGQPAEIFENFLRQQLEQGQKSFLVIPLFFGLSRALTSFIPQQVEKLQAEFKELHVRVADVVYPLPEGDIRLAQILFDHIKTAQASFTMNAKLVLVDHGSPSPNITAVRNRVAKNLRNMPGATFELAEAVMERREGKAYDFNGDLLEDWLRQQAQKGVEAAIVAMMFFLPGRHAGSCGDIETICENVVKQHPHLQYRITPLIGEHPLLLEILSDRLRSVEEK
jgi:sirohydrochlorin ferrochelatase